MEFFIWQHCCSGHCGCTQPYCLAIEDFLSSWPAGHALSAKCTVTSWSSFMEYDISASRRNIHTYIFLGAAATEAFTLPASGMYDQYTTVHMSINFWQDGDSGMQSIGRFQAGRMSSVEWCKNSFFVLNCLSISETSLLQGVSLKIVSVQELLPFLIHKFPSCSFMCLACTNASFTPPLL